MPAKEIQPEQPFDTRGKVIGHDQHSNDFRTEGETSYAVNAYLEYPWPMSSIARQAEAVYLTDRSDIAPPQGVEPEEHYSWWTFTNPPITDIVQLPGTLDWDAIYVQISPKRHGGEVAGYVFLDSHVKAMKFERTWGDQTRNMHYPFKD